MTRRAALRASDSDREHFADRLRHAAGEGRLVAEELEERLGAVFSARTYGELDAVVADLPAERTPGHGLPVWARAGLVLSAALAVLAVLAAVAFVVLAFAGAWLLWIAFAWVFLGRGRIRCMGRSRRRVVATGPRVIARVPGSGRVPSL